MTRFDCYATRDVLPLVYRQECSSGEAAAVAAHLELCEDCRRDGDLIAVLSTSQPAVPPELEARVVAALGRGGRRWAPVRLAAAATVAAAILGGILVFERFGLDPVSRSTPATIGFDDSGAPLVSWAVTHDPLLHSGTGLHELTVEELELVLAELES
jgi:predicted anti-sigma-YlaC factor YlaD